MKKFTGLDKAELIDELKPIIQKYLTKKEWKSISAFYEEGWNAIFGRLTFTYIIQRLNELPEQTIAVAYLNSVYVYGMSLHRGIDTRMRALAKIIATERAMCSTDIAF